MATFAQYVQKTLPYQNLASSADAGQIDLGGWVVAKTTGVVYSRTPCWKETVAEYTPTWNAALTTEVIDPINGNAFRTLYKHTGTFTTGNWLFRILSAAITQPGSADGAPLIKLWRSTDPDNAGGTAITGWLQLSTRTNITAVPAIAHTLTTSINGFSLAGEYLFVQVCWMIASVGAGSSTTCDVHLWSSTAADGPLLTTTTWTAAPDSGFTTDSGIGTTTAAGTEVSLTDSDSTSDAGVGTTTASGAEVSMIVSDSTADAGVGATSGDGAEVGSAVDSDSTADTASGTTAATGSEVSFIVSDQTTDSANGATTAAGVVVAVIEDHTTDAAIGATSMGTSVLAAGSTSGSASGSTSAAAFVIAAAHASDAALAYDYAGELGGDSTLDFVLGADLAYGVEVAAPVVDETVWSCAEVAYGLLIADPGVAAVISGRVFPNRLPQGTQLPAIVYSVALGLLNSLDGFTANLHNSKLTVVCYDYTYLGARELARKVDELFRSHTTLNWSSRRKSIRGRYDDANQAFAQAVDVSVWHVEQG